MLPAAAETYVVVALPSAVALAAIAAVVTIWRKRSGGSSE